MPWIAQSGIEYTTGPQTFSFTNTVATIAVPNTATAGDIVTFGTPSAGFNAGQLYYVIATGLSGSGLQLSATSGGSAQVPNATTTNTGQIEHIAISDTTNFTYYAQVDTSAIQPAITGGLTSDIIELRLYTYDTGQTTYVQTWKATYQWLQINNQKASPFVPSDAGIRLTFRQTNVALGAALAVTFTGGGSANFTLTSNNLQVGDPVFFTGTTAPTGFANNQMYYVLTSAGTTLTVAATPGGAAVTASTTGTAESINLGGRYYRWKLLKQ
jgi:hypothetical protein